MTTTPFDGKSGHYRRFRPDYPPEAIERLLRRARLSADRDVADLGSGTGLLTRHLLAHARLVYAIEPEDEMRRAAETALGREPRFRSVAAAAEATGLPGASVDAIVSGNAFHYFEPVRMREEVTRLLRPGGCVVLLFHEPPPVPEPFMADYLGYLTKMTPPEFASSHSAADYDRRLSLFFGGRAPLREGGEHAVRLTWAELAGLFSSSSIAPRDDAPAYGPALRELKQIFDRHERSQTVVYRLAWICLSAAWS